MLFFDKVKNSLVNRAAECMAASLTALLLWVVYQVSPALIPAIEYMKNERKNTDDIAVILQAAAKGSKVGVEQSKDMYPSIGRSKNFREQAIGYPDPGAVSVSIIIKSFADSVLENNKNKGE